MLNKTGVPSLEEVKAIFPDREKLKKPKAIVECYEEIPCNPCSTSCPFDAIYIGDDINSCPVVDFDKCTGCAICVYNCPGLAIVVAENKGEKIRFKIPYELLPLPKVGEIWEGVNRNGDIICEARIEKVLMSPKQDKTALIHVLVDERFVHDFITIREVKNG